MTHAQDHLANAISWSRMCQLLIDQMEREEAESYE
jgi:PTS system cellobiose-specific IIA component/PTS system lactose-specific IIA component